MKDLGVILLHGKRRTKDDPLLAKLARDLGKSESIVSRPEMAWSQERIYDKTVSEALDEIQYEIHSLRSRGANKIVVAGHSLGGTVAICYAAERGNIDGVIAMAPGHKPDSPHPSIREKIFSEVRRAEQLIASGEGDTRTTFFDPPNDLGDLLVTPKIFATWWRNEGGQLVAPTNIKRVGTSIPLLYVVGRDDAVNRPIEEVFGEMSKHHLSNYAEVEAEHQKVPNAEATRSTVLAWIAQLAK